MSQNTVIEYPTGLSSIPYASFLQIEKYAYSEAQKKVADQQNDALGSVSRSSIGGIVNTAADGFANVYGSGDASNNNKFSTYKTEERNWLGVKKNVDISDANVDKNTVVEVNGEKITVGQLLKKKQELIDRKSKGLMSTRCMLPLPNEFQYKYGADWNNEFKLGTLALAADELGRFSTLTAAGGLLGGGLSFATDKLTQGSGVAKVGGVNVDKLVSGAAGGVSTAADPFKVNSTLNPKNIAGLAGLAPNENSIQFFERMQGREFGFRFELAARNKQESNRIVEIIEWFKRGMHPGSKNGKGSAVLLTFPDVFVLTPKFVKCGTNGLALGDPIQHPMMPKTKLCALTGLTINTTPFGQLQTIFDGSIPLVTMELSFKETTKLTRVDMEGASFTDKTGIGNSGTYTRDTDRDYTGVVTY
tara:strand:- start:1021 stop:2271 length:1251 start_codon:yes stop_codon:yes gene_type:complete